MKLNYVSATFIQDETDYNQLTTPGNYYCSSAAHARTMINCPVTTNHRLIILQRASANTITQIIFASDSNSSVFIRNGVESEWNKIAWQRSIDSILSHESEIDQSIDDILSRESLVEEILDIELVEEVNKANTSIAKGAHGSDLFSGSGLSGGVYFPIGYPISNEKTYVVTMRYNNGDSSRACKWAFVDENKSQLSTSVFVNLTSGLPGVLSAAGIIVFPSNVDNYELLQSATIDWINLVEDNIAQTHGGTEYPYINPTYRSATIHSIEQEISGIVQSDNSPILGIMIAPDGTVSRTDDAIGKTNDYVVGSSFQNGGINDFDSFYPWSEIKPCNIYTDANGDEQIVYADQTGFTRNGSNGDVYVEIPKFYSLRYEDNNGNQYIKISSCPRNKFLLEPCFYDSVTGREIDKIYVAAYHFTGDSTLHSVSGEIPITDKPLSYFKDRGEIYDFVTLQAIQKLFSVEFATIDSSLIFGGYSNLPWNNAIYPTENVSSTNTGEFIGDSRIRNLKVGSIVSISQTFGLIENREITAITPPVVQGSRWKRTITFTGSPINLIPPDSSLPASQRQKLYCSAQKTGSTDTLIYHTGRTDDTEYSNDSLIANQFRYRWMEGLWGTIGELIDGVVVKNLRLYWDNIKSNYGNPSVCHKINFKLPLQNTYSTSDNPLPPYVKKMGIDFRYPQIAVPQILTEDTNYYGDGFFSVDNVGPDGQTYDENTIFIGCSSMAWDGKYGNGLYCLRFWSPSTTGGSWLYGSRLIKRHFD